MVLLLCTSSDNALYFNKISQRLSELLSGHEIMTDGQTDGQGDNYRAPPTSFGGALINEAVYKTR